MCYLRAIIIHYFLLVIVGAACVCVQDGQCTVVKVRFGLYPPW